MERVVVTGATTPLGRRLLSRLRKEPGVEKVIGLEEHQSGESLDGVEFVGVGQDERAIARLLCDQAIDTVIHAGLTPGRSGRLRNGPSDVIGTMRLCAAASHSAARVRSLVLVSSSAAYPVDSYAPLLYREEDPTDSGELEPTASLLEAEEYARDMAERLGAIDVAILRLAEPAGAGLVGPLGAALLQPVAPSPLGYDPPMQWLHANDAVGAILFAAAVELAGVYNVASAGLLRWSEALALRGGYRLPVIPFESGPFAPLLRRVGVPHVPEGAGPLLRYGSSLDTAKLRSAGWRPGYGQRECVLALER